MIYRFRIILDTKEDVFRDIEIEAEATLEDFHNTITQSFGFEGQEMASFYVSNEKWEQGKEWLDKADEINLTNVFNRWNAFKYYLRFEKDYKSAAIELKRLNEIYKKEHDAYFEAYQNRTLNRRF